MNNTKKIQEKLVSAGLDALLISDEKNQRYACGFPFTDGAVLVTTGKTYLFTDSRYIEAAQKALDPEIELRQFGGGKRLHEYIREALEESHV